MSETIAEVTILQHDPQGPMFQTTIWVIYDETKLLNVMKEVLNDGENNGILAILKSWVVKSRNVANY